VYSDANEILLAAQRSEEGDALVFVEHPKSEPTDTRWIGNPSRDGLPYFNLNRARAIRHEEIRLGRSMTPAEQDAHIRKLCE
jgi:hypothetical protein